MEVPMLRKAKGSIVNIGAIEGLGANPHHAAYAASKAGAARTVARRRAGPW